MLATRMSLNHELRLRLAVINPIASTPGLYEDVAVTGMGFAYSCNSLLDFADASCCKRPVFTCDSRWCILLEGREMQWSEDLVKDGESSCRPGEVRIFFSSVFGFTSRT